MLDLELIARPPFHLGDAAPLPTARLANRLRVNPDEAAKHGLKLPEHIVTMRPAPI